MGSVYLARKNGIVVHHTDLQAMKDIDGIDAPELTITDMEFEAAGGLARIINDGIFLGKTAAEIAVEANQARVVEIDAELRTINEKAARSVQAVTSAIVRGEQPDDVDVRYLQEYEDRAEELRSERGGLV
jgi:hypothetical protein